jgi:hypothetical protein
MEGKLNMAVDVLLEQLQEELQRVSETKRMINSLRKRMGQDPMFPEGAEADGVGGRADQYYGKPLATAARDYLALRNEARSVEQILKGLEQGGFDFRALEWKDDDRLRSLAISLAKNTQTFHKLPNGTIGLVSWYDAKTLKRAEHSSSNGAK